MLKMEAALSVAEALFRATAGKEFYDVYARPTLVSYGASCKVLTAWHKETQKKVRAEYCMQPSTNPRQTLN